MRLGGGGGEGGGEGGGGGRGAQRERVRGRKQGGSRSMLPHAEIWVPQMAGNA